MTENRRRTANIIKTTLSKYDGSLSTVLYQFVRRGVLLVSSDQPFDAVMEHAINIGAEDLEEAGDETFKVLLLENLRIDVEVFVKPEAVTSIARTFSDSGYQVQSAESHWLPLPDAEMEVDQEGSEKVSRFIASLEADDDVIAVYTNAVIRK
jgi:transcriptional/translational regulatory protein YebC/TACO1